MRFALAHKASSYLMVASAFFAMLVGGGVAPAVGLLGALALIASWWWEAPRVRLDRWSIVWSIASLVVLGWVVATALTTGDWFGTGATFLVWLTVAKAFNRRSSRDWQQLYLLAFLMLVAGSVLNEGLSYGLAFLGFVIASTWAMILSHLRREMEDNFLLKHADDRASERVEVRRILESRRIVGGRFFAGTGLISLLVFLVSSVLFVSIPRIGAGFFIKRKDGLTFAGFRDGVKLGGHGRIKGDDTIVMRIEIDEPYRGRDAPYVHWRAVAFDEYSGGEWRRSPRAPMTLSITDDAEAGRQRRHVLHDSAEAGSLDDRLTGAVKQTIYLQPIGTDALFGASMPLAFEHERPRERPARKVQRNDEIRFEHRDQLRYTVWSQIAPPPPARLRAAGEALPEGYEVYTGWPKTEISDATVKLALRLTAGHTNDYDRARAIEDYLREELTYTLDLEDPGGREPIDFFLFERGKGHCEYFASAFAILARIAGVPTRQVNGFLGGEWNEYDGYIAVRAGDAHSWNEVYFPGEGWVTFDATPASQDRLGRGGDGLSDRLRRFVDTLRFQWMKWVIDYDLGRQVGLFKDLGDGLADAGRWVEARWDDVVDWAREHVVIAALLGLALIGLVAWRWRRRRRAPGGAGATTRPRPRSPIAALYTRVLGRLERRGWPRAPATTPRELARTAAARGAPFAAALGELTEIYYAAQWGGEDAASLEARARALASEIEAALAEVRSPPMSA